MVGWFYYLRFKVLFWGVGVLCFVVGLPVLLGWVLMPFGGQRGVNGVEAELVEVSGVDVDVVIVEGLSLWGFPVAGYVNMFDVTGDTVYMRPFGDSVDVESVWVSKLVHEAAHSVQRDVVVDNFGFGWGYVFGLLGLNSVGEELFLGEDYDLGGVSFKGLERNADCLSVLLSPFGNVTVLSYTATVEYCDSFNVALASGLLEGEVLGLGEVYSEGFSGDGFVAVGRNVGGGGFEK